MPFYGKRGNSTSADRKHKKSILLPVQKIEENGLDTTRTKSAVLKQIDIRALTPLYPVLVTHVQIYYCHTRTKTKRGAAL